MRRLEAIKVLTDVCVSVKVKRLPPQDIMPNNCHSCHQYSVRNLFLVEKNEWHHLTCMQGQVYPVVIKNMVEERLLFVIIKRWQQYIPHLLLLGTNITTGYKY